MNSACPPWAENPLVVGRWTEALACDLLLVLDQAEEYFLYHAEGIGFAHELPELVTRPRPNAGAGDKADDGQLAETTEEPSHPPT